MTSSRAHSVELAERPPARPFEAGLESTEATPWRAIVETLFLRYAVMALALAALGVAVVHLDPLQGARDWDVAVSRWFAEGRSPAWNDIAMFGSNVGDTVAIVGVALVVVALLISRHHRREAALVAFGLALEAATFITANHLVRRDRPPVHTLGEAPTTFSFPSGHVAAAVVLYGALALLVSRTVRSTVIRIAVWVVPVVVAGLVAWARVYRGMHFATDVLTGLALGVAALVVTVRLVCPAEPDTKVGS